MSRILILAGAVLILAGVLAALVPKLPMLGRLPGDIRIEKDNFTFYFPLATGLLLSAIVSFIIWLVRQK